MDTAILAVVSKPLEVEVKHEFQVGIVTWVCSIRLLVKRPIAPIKEDLDISIGFSEKILVARDIRAVRCNACRQETVLRSPIDLIATSASDRRGRPTHHLIASDLPRGWREAVVIGLRQLSSWDLFLVLFGIIVKLS